MTIPGSRTARQARIADLLQRRLLPGRTAVRWSTPANGPEVWILFGPDYGKDFHMVLALLIDHQEGRMDDFADAGVAQFRHHPA